MFSRIGNPLDLGIFGGMRRSGEVPLLLMNDPEVSVVLGLLHSMNPWQGDPYRAALAAAREATGRPMLIVSPGGLPTAERTTYETIGMEVFTEMDIVLEGIGALLTGPPSPLPAIAGMPAPVLPARQLSEPESLALLHSFGVPTVPTVVCGSVTEARAAAEQLGFPVVLKGVRDGVAHKSDLGLVHVGLRDAAAVADAFAAAGCAKVVIQPMIRGELEAIAGDDHRRRRRARAARRSGRYPRRGAARRGHVADPERPRNDRTAVCAAVPSAGYCTAIAGNTRTRPRLSSTCCWPCKPLPFHLATGCAPSMSTR